MQLSDSDYQTLHQQLGRRPSGIVDIAARAQSESASVPTVLKMRAWLDAKPFPTLYWLCSKDLHKAINQIETAGYVKLLEQTLELDDELMQMHLQDQRRYQRLRLESMHDLDRAQLQKVGLLDTFEQTGIGGIKDLHKVRCLHMQYAYHLATLDQGGSMIGRRLDNEFQLNTLKIRI